MPIQKDQSTYLLSVKLIEANLSNDDYSLCDVLAEFFVGFDDNNELSRKRTHTIKSTLTPEWNTRYGFIVDAKKFVSGTATLFVRLLDRREVRSGKEIATYTLMLPKFFVKHQLQQVLYHYRALTVFLFFNLFLTNFCCYNT